MPTDNGMTLRPYQLLCAVCAVGEGAPCEGKGIARILASFKEQPDAPLTLRCNAGEVFAWQDPGPADDAPPGAEFNLKRDLEVLHRINLFPGATLTPRIVMNRVLDRIEDVADLCVFAGETVPAWTGCAKAAAGFYRRGREQGIAAFIPARTAAGMQADKDASIARMKRERPVKVRPHILACAVCQFGNGTLPPYPEDNLPELLQVILAEPGTELEMAPHADWMMCAPCPFRSAGLNACVHNKGSGGLPNQMRDLRVLQKLGLTYGSVVKARDFFRLLFDRIPGTLALCRLDHPAPSVWHTGCGTAPADSPNYENGKRQLIALLKL